MSRRITLWPYDHEYLQLVAGGGDRDFLAEMDKRLRSELRDDPDWEAEWRQAAEIAHEVVANGFPPIGDFQESDSHHYACELLVQPCIPRNRNRPDSTFNLIEFSDAMDSALQIGPRERDPFVDGRPWFGRFCAPESIYGTLQRSELPMLVDRLIAIRDSYGEDAEWAIDPIVDFLRFSSKHSCDVWYTG